MGAAFAALRHIRQYLIHLELSEAPENPTSLNADCPGQLGEAHSVPQD